MFDPIAFARRLIDIPSPTDDEYTAASFLFDELTRLGYQCRKQPVTDSRFNVFADAGGRPRVVFNSHIDTAGGWIKPSEDHEFVCGRGACDAKGVIAAMVAAGERLRGDGVHDFAYLFVVGEETDSIGAKSANAAFRDLGSEFLVVGEPTESKFVRASKGALTCFVHFKGIAGHSAYPEQGESAINKMVAAIAEINATDWGSHEVLGKANVNVGVVRGGKKPNVIPASAGCDMIFRTVGDNKELLERLAILLAGHGGRIKKERGNGPQFMVVPDGAPSTVVAFNSDVPHLGALGKPLLFGPGSILDAHGPAEKIAKRELIAAIEIYRSTVMKLLEGTTS